MDKAETTRLSQMSVDVPHRAEVAQSYALARGPRVQLRPARSSDLESLRGLAAKAGVVCDDLELARLVRSAPGSRLVLCATAGSGSQEVVLGVGVIELGRSLTMPSFVLVDTELTDGLGRVIVDALVERARELADPRVA
jgi:hypothetical protein